MGYDHPSERFAGTDTSLSDTHTITFYLLRFAGFFCFDELAKLKESDVAIYTDHMELFVDSSKTGQFRVGPPKMPEFLV